MVSLNVSKFNGYMETPLRVGFIPHCLSFQHLPSSLKFQLIIPHIQSCIRTSLNPHSKMQSTLILLHHVQLEQGSSMHTCHGTMLRRAHLLKKFSSRLTCLLSLSGRQPPNHEQCDKTPLTSHHNYSY